MRNKITMEMSICQAENRFSLDELVKKLADAFENKAFADILKMSLKSWWSKRSAEQITAEQSTSWSVMENFRYRSTLLTAG